jgi:hypothetical protein
VWTCRWIPTCRRKILYPLSGLKMYMIFFSETLLCMASQPRRTTWAKDNLIFGISPRAADRSTPKPFPTECNTTETNANIYPFPCKIRTQDPSVRAIQDSTVCLSGELTRPSNISTHLRRRTVVLIRGIETSADYRFSISFLALRLTLLFFSISYFI